MNLGLFIKYVFGKDKLKIALMNEVHALDKEIFPSPKQESKES
jgi:hypothetical protein